MPAGRSFSPGHFALMLDGAMAGWLHNVQGGAAIAEFVGIKVGSDAIVQRNLSPVRFEDIVVTCGTGMSKAFYDWVALASEMNGATRKNGEIVVYDGGNKELSRMEFRDALITEISFPAVGATSKDAGSLTVKISPESVKHKAGDGSAAASAVQTRKAWNGSSFRFAIGGLEEASRRVIDIEAITIVWKKVTHSTAGSRSYSIQLGTGDPGNLNLTLPESHAQGFFDWFDDFVIKGRNGPSQEKTGSLEYLTPDLKTTLFTLEFQNLGPLQMTQPSKSAGAKTVGQVKIQIYCGSIKFKASSAA